MKMALNFRWPSDTALTMAVRSAQMTNWREPFSTLQPVMEDIDGSVQDCSISIANALDILQSCTKTSKWCLTKTGHDEVMTW